MPRQEMLRRIIDLYDAWHEAEPDQGHGTKAAEWRAKLPPEDRASSLITLGFKLLEKRAKPRVIAQARHKYRGARCSGYRRRREPPDWPTGFQ